MKITPQRVLVTAAAGAMGRAIVRRLLEDGHEVYGADLSGRRLEELDTDLAASPEATQMAGHMKVDVTSRANAQELVARAQDVLGGIDGLVNVVGGYRGELYVPVTEIDDERFDSAVDMTLRATFLLTQLCAPAMMSNRFGRIVNVGSIAMNGAEGQADYAGLKAGVIGFTRTCAMELAPSVNVNAVVPGVIDTMVMDRMPGEMQDRYRERIPLDRWGRPAEVASVVSFLISDDASYVTGEDIYVSGGFRSWM